MVRTDILLGNGKVQIECVNLTFNDTPLKAPAIRFSELPLKFPVGSKITKDFKNTSTQITLIIPDIKSLEVIEGVLARIRSSLEKK